MEPAAPCKFDKSITDTSLSSYFTLIKSTIGAVPKNKKTIEALGLSKLYKTVELPDNAATAGALRKVAPYVKVEEV